MPIPRAPVGPLIASLLVLAISIQACSGPYVRVRHVPDNGYAQTINYQFKAEVHDDDSGNCRMMVVRVKALNKMYSKQEPPPRLQLVDDDCSSPLRFERVQYLHTDTGQHVRLSGLDVVRFLGEYSRLEDELIGWLWREGVI